MNTRTQIRYSGLVLAGGDSQRMGHDKALIDYHGCPQWKWIAHLLEPKCSEVYISKNLQQTWSVEGVATPLIDTEQSVGPFHPWSKLSALQPANHWLIISSDLPHITSEAVDYLTHQFQSMGTDHEAAAYYATDASFPDPQITLLSPIACEKARAAYDSGVRSPRRFLEQVKTLLLKVSDKQYLASCDTPLESDQAKKRIQNTQFENNPS